MCYSSFSYDYADHRDLHSFPTRRSSDLTRRSSSSCANRRRSSTTSSRRPSRCSPTRRPCTTPPCCSTRRSSGCRRTRSEEHTSELQSHSDLVCRLLLEKKKKQITNKTQL